MILNRLYQVVIWNFDYTFRPNRAAKRIGVVTVSAPTPLKAAGQAYVHLVGRKRAKRMIKMEAPEVIIRHETDAEGLASEVIRTSIGPKADFCVAFDNLVEAWILSIKQVASARYLAFQWFLRASLPAEPRESNSEWLDRVLKNLPRN